MPLSSLGNHKVCTDVDRYFSLSMKWGDKQHAGVAWAVRPLGRNRFGRGLPHAGGPVLPEVHYFLNFSPVSGSFRISTYSLIKGEKMPYMTSTSLGRMWLKSHIWLFSFDTEKYFFSGKFILEGTTQAGSFIPSVKGLWELPPWAMGEWAMGEAEASCPPLIAFCLPGAGTGCPRDCRQRPPPAGPILLLCYFQIKKRKCFGRAVIIPSVSIYILKSPSHI